MMVLPWLSLVHSSSCPRRCKTTTWIAKWVEGFPTTSHLQNPLKPSMLMPTTGFWGTVSWLPEQSHGVYLWVLRCSDPKIWKSHLYQWIFRLLRAKGVTIFCTWYSRDCQETVFFPCRKEDEGKGVEEKPQKLKCLNDEMLDTEECFLILDIYCSVERSTKNASTGMFFNSKMKKGENLIWGIAKICMLCNCTEVYHISYIHVHPIHAYVHTYVFTYIFLSWKKLCKGIGKVFYLQLSVEKPLRQPCTNQIKCYGCWWTKETTVVLRCLSWCYHRYI